MTSIFRAANGAKTDACQDIQARLEERVRVLKFPERLDLFAGTLLKHFQVGLPVSPQVYTKLLRVDERSGPLPCAAPGRRLSLSFDDPQRSSPSRVRFAVTCPPKTRPI